MKSFKSIVLIMGAFLCESFYAMELYDQKEKEPLLSFSLPEYNTKTERQNHIILDIENLAKNNEKIGILELAPPDIWYQIIEYLPGDNAFLNRLIRIIKPNKKITNKILNCFKSYIEHTADNDIQILNKIENFYKTTFLSSKENYLYHYWDDFRKLKLLLCHNDSRIREALDVFLMNHKDDTKVNVKILQSLKKLYCQNFTKMESLPVNIYLQYRPHCLVFPVAVH